MWLFWIGAGVLAAAAAALVVARATGAASAEAAPEDPAVAVYRRQLAELDDLASRGLLGEAERRAAHAEAARRLLGAADRSGPAEGGAAPSARWILLAALGTAVLAALGLYLLLGSPGFPDQPYRARVAAWRAHPQAARPAEMAAVLRDLVKERPRDAQAREFLGRAELEAGDPIEAAAAFRQAIALEPRRADLQVMLGQALIAGAEGAPPPEAETAFRQALALDPSDLPARYFLARTQIARGERAAGLAGWQALRAELAPDDPRRATLEADMGRVLAGDTGGPGEAANQGGGDQAAFIKAMVDRLAARLKTAPDDPDGWARLVRAYRVLGDRSAESQALDRARKLFAGRPADLAKVEAEAARPQ